MYIYSYEACQDYDLLCGQCLSAYLHVKKKGKYEDAIWIAVSILRSSLNEVQLHIQVKVRLQFMDHQQARDERKKGDCSRPRVKMKASTTAYKSELDIFYIMQALHMFLA